MQHSEILIIMHRFFYCEKLVETRSRLSDEEKDEAKIYLDGWLTVCGQVNHIGKW